MLDSASFPLRHHTALLCVRRHPDEITMAHARAIFRRCLSISSQPIDPYAPVPLAMAARSAGASLLLAHNPKLDQEILPQIRTGELALVTQQPFTRDGFVTGRAFRRHWTRYGRTRHEPSVSLAIVIATTRR